MKGNRDSRIRRKAVWAVLVMLLIFIHSAMPSDLSSLESGHVVELIRSILGFLHLPEPEGLAFVVRKLGHFTEFALLGITYMNLAGSLVPGLPQAFSLTLTAGVLYAATDEFHQRFVPGRSCEFRDVCIDAAGVAAGAGMILLILLIGKRRRRKHGHI